MKIVLLVLSGDPDQARAWLRQRYPGAVIESIPRDQLESNAPLGRIRVLRSLRPEIFAVATERLAWQRGQNALLLFGALAGARRVVIIDTSGDSRQETSAAILSRMPFRFASESAASALAITKSHAHLKRLEQAIRNRATLGSGGAGRKPDAVRIAYLRSTPSAGTQAGGAATHINGFVRGATELGAEVTVISNDRIAGFDETKFVLIDPEPVGTTRASFDLRNNLIFSVGALREIERSPVDLIYQRYGRFTWAGVEAGLRTGLPLFLEYNGSEVWIGKHWDMSGMIPLLERFERLNLDAATRIFVVSDVERRNLLRAGIADEKIVVNPNGVDTEKFRPGIGSETVRRELGVAADETLAGFVGTFGPWHGVLTLAEAVTLLPTDSGVRFLLVGAGRFREEVERIIRAAGKEGQVIFTGHVDHERVPALLDACDILLSPHVPLEDGSEFFGSPTKLFEYMSMGKGIVASRLGQIGEVLADRETALLTEPGDAMELADAILRLSISRELRERLGAAARQAAIAKHTWKHNAQRVLDAYVSWSTGLKKFGVRV
ncbi:MAG TPA: glycosyltransferase family 4 protein [Pyrinomonadaceae bacterium]|nr:glycosyltransferase family 4 protein [Pyrinomonadaceae bacterium]